MSRASVIVKERKTTMNRSRALTATLGVALLLPACANPDQWINADAGGAAAESGTLAAGGCEPGAATCEGNQVLRCRPDGKGYTKGESCAWPLVCNYGACQPSPACVTAKAVSSYVGCEYFAVDLDNAPAAAGYSPRDAEFAIVVSNATLAETPVKVKLFAKDTGQERLLAEGTVASNDVAVFKITPPLNVLGTVKAMLGIRLVSDGPVTAYQFNPLNNTDKAYSNDASLLIPVTSLDRAYVATTGDGIRMNDTLDKTKTFSASSYLTVVGTEDGTKVRVTPSSDVEPGAGVSSGGKGPIEVMLNRYEVLNVSSFLSQTPGIPTHGQSNLSGSMILADKPVAVFSGNVCALMPLEVVVDGLNKKLKCCCDHLEEQLFPLSAWGKQFVASHTESRLKAGGEKNYYRITGGADAITLTWSPATPTGAPAKLSKGESVEFASPADFILSASGPVQLVQFLSSSDDVATSSGKACATHADCSAEPYLAACHAISKKCVVVGDPFMTLVPPVEQFRDKYVFLTPTDYLYDFVNLVGPLDAAITLDGKSLPPLTSVGSVGGVEYGVARVAVGDGKHVLSSSKRIGVLVYGVDAYVSYGYPAGLDLQKINPIE